MFYIYINDQRFEVSGCEAAYAAYQAGVTFAERLGATCALVDGETGEVLEDTIG